jgi:hypothetical protein
MLLPPKMSPSGSARGVFLFFTNGVIPTPLPPQNLQGSMAPAKLLYKMSIRAQTEETKAIEAITYFQRSIKAAFAGRADGRNFWPAEGTLVPPSRIRLHRREMDNVGLHYRQVLGAIRWLATSPNTGAITGSASKVRRQASCLTSLKRPTTRKKDHRVVVWFRSVVVKSQNRRSA